MVSPLSAPATSDRGARPVVESQPTGAVRVEGAVPLAAAVPSSAKVCENSACISLQGGGLRVNYWSTSVSNQNQTCTHAHFIVAGEDVRTTGQQCGKTSFSQTWQVKRDFDNGTQVCNRWDGFEGEPCLNVWPPNY